AGANPVIEPQFAPPEVNVFSVTVRAVVSAESLTLIAVKSSGFWMVRAPRMPWTLPALHTVTVSRPKPELRPAGPPVASKLVVARAAGVRGRGGVVGDL